MNLERQSITGYWIEPDEKTSPLLVALGQLLISATGLEKGLLIEIARLRAEDEGLSEELGRELSRLERLPAGALRDELRKFELPDDLNVRIADAIDGRNHVVHHLMEDPDMIRVVTAGEGVDEMVERITSLAADCAELATELIVVAAQRLAPMLPPDTLQTLLTCDLDTIADPQMRKQIEAMRAAF